MPAEARIDRRRAREGQSSSRTSAQAVRTGRRTLQLVPQGVGRSRGQGRDPAQAKRQTPGGTFRAVGRTCRGKENVNSSCGPATAAFDSKEGFMQPLNVVIATSDT